VGGTYHPRRCFAAAASYGTLCTVHLRPVRLRRSICAEGDRCGLVQRMVSASGLVGLALVRSSPTLNFRSHDGSTIAYGDESAMSLRQKVYSPEFVEEEFSEVRIQNLA
jgi:hypothetical protein